MSSTQMIGLSLPVYSPPSQTLHRWSLQGANAGSLLNGVLAACYPEGYDVVILQRQEFEDPRSDPPPVCADFVDGLIYAAPNSQYNHYTRFLDTGLPIVTIGQELSGKPIPYVTLSNENEIQRLTRALIRIGHTDIGLVLPMERAQDHSRFVQIGYEEAHQAVGLPIHPEYIVEGTTGSDAGLRLMALPKRPKVIIVGRNDIALDLLAAIQEKGIRCPEDVEIVVFGDEHGFEQSRPRLTAVEGHIFDIGYDASQLLFKLLRGEQPESFGRTIPWTLMARDSCGIQSL